MPEFAYKAARADGGVTEGQVSAPSRAAAMSELRKRGVTPLRVEESTGRAPAKASASASAGGRWWQRKRIGHAEVLSMTTELAIMLRAGLPLDRALKVLGDIAPKPTMKALLEDILRTVKAGKGFSHALREHEALFGDFYINMVRSGEAGGQMAEVLQRLAEHLERMRAARESVTSALMYPAILVLVSIVSIAIMLGFVVPQFESLFRGMGEALPLATRIVIAVGNFFKHWGWALVLAVSAWVWLLRRWWRTPRGRQSRDARMAHLPVFGTIVRKFEVTRFTRTLGTLLGNGVPILGALAIAIETIGNLELRARLVDVPGSVKQGTRFAEALSKVDFLSPVALNMVRVGEETGRLDSMLLEVARVGDTEVQAATKRALTLLEPLLILTLGLAIGAIIISILMGIISVNELAN